MKKQFVLMGHRGVGKTSLLKKLKQRYQEFQFISLDQEIEKVRDESIGTLFEKYGEEEFRRIETQVFQSCVERLQEQAFVIDLGGGFSGGIPVSIQTLWVRRQSHNHQALFIDRPSLNGQLSIGLERFQQREERYQKQSDFVVELREGERFFGAGEKLLFDALFLNKTSERLKSFYYTLLPTTTEFEIEILTKLGVKGFEWRDDLTSSPWDHDLVFPSLRKKPKDCSAAFFDWPLEWGENPKAPLLSLHQRKASVQETVALFPQGSKALLKLAIPIHSFEELREGHNWMMQDPGQRSFLPMSEDGRWNWYRLWMSPFMGVNFLRTGLGSASDQPSLLQVLNHPVHFSQAAAVLGAPVAHSQSPSFHQDFFANKDIPFLAITIEEPEFEAALDLLSHWGLKWVAVTSPLKQKASQKIKAEHSINTLVFHEQQWQGLDTDRYGLEQAIGENAEGVVAVWGGGGTHDAIRSVLPNVAFYSSRTGELKGGPSESPSLLIWAVGAKAFAQKGCLPPKEWPVEKLIDLNYTQDSPGLAAAHHFQCEYQSGQVMFRAQAKKQQAFWKEFLEVEKSLPIEGSSG